MSEEWEEFNGVSKAIHSPLVSIIKAGRFAFNKEAARLLGDHSHVELLFNRKEHKIGLRLRKKESNTSRRISRGDHSWLVHAKRFFDRYGIDCEESKRYPVIKEGDILTIPLNDPIK